MNRPRAHLIVAAEYHDTDFVRRELLGLLAEDDRIATSCAAGFEAASAVAAANLLITYTSNVFPDAAQLQALRRFLEAGGRWLALHASAAYTCFRPPEIDIGGIRLPGLTDTPDAQPDYMDILGCRFVSHLAPRTITLTPASNHPLVAGLPPFDIIDEPYILERRAACEVLLESRYVGDAPGYVAGPWHTDEPRPQMLLRRLGAGEIVYLAPGHACGRFDLQPFIAELPVQRGPWLHESYREIIRRTIRWGIGASFQAEAAA